MILNGLYLFEGQSSTGDSPIIYNTKGSILVLQVKCDSTFAFKVKGSLELSGNDYNDISVVDMSSLDKAESVSSEGIFQADISGCKKIKLDLTSIGAEPITVYGLVKEG